MARAKQEIEGQGDLYERDFYLWIEEQATLLREGRLERLDVANLLEEMEDVGRREKKVVKSNLVVVLTHLLKHQFQADQSSNSWRGSILEHRRRLRDDFEDSPSLRRHAAEMFGGVYEDAREQASTETGLPLHTFPKASPYSLEQTLDPDFLPD